MFDKEAFISQCIAMNKLEDGYKRIKKLVAQIIENPSEVINVLGEPAAAGFDILYRSDDLTIINFVWAPGMELHAHNHNIWAVIGIYAGVEENTFYVRKNESIIKQNVKNLGVGDVVLLGENVIHSVRNPTERATAGIHVYGGDFVSIGRSEWDMKSFRELPYDMEHTKQVFADANKHWQSSAMQSS